MVGAVHNNESTTITTRLTGIVGAVHKNESTITRLTGIVGAVHDGSDGQTQGNSELSSGRTSTSSLRHLRSVRIIKLNKISAQTRIVKL